jgi:hypothetical protein
MILTPELLGIFALTTAIGYSMLLAGVHKSMLEWRASRRPCPSCGRQIEGRVCGPCTGSA